MTIVWGAFLYILKLHFSISKADVGSTNFSVAVSLHVFVSFLTLS